MYSFSTFARAFLVSMFLIYSGLKYEGAISKNHEGLMSITVLM